MTTFAAIKDGKVIDLWDRPASFEHIEPGQIFNPGQVDKWVDVSTLDPRPAWGWTYDGTRFAPPPPPT